MAGPGGPTPSRADEVLFIGFAVLCVAAFAAFLIVVIPMFYWESKDVYVSVVREWHMFLNGDCPEFARYCKKQ